MKGRVGGVHTLQGNVALEQLAIEGHGLNNSSATPGREYAGLTSDFQHSVDNQTLYFGPLEDTGECAGRRRRISSAASF